jgi:hypothetical protein
MDIQIKVEDYLTPERIAEICEDEVRAVIRGYMRSEDNFQRIVTNGAYHLVQKCIDEDLQSKGKTYEEILKAEVSRVVGNGLNIWDIFRYADPMYNRREDNVGVQILNEAIRNNKSAIEKAVEDVIAQYDFREVRAEIADTCYAILERKLLGGAGDEK